MTFGSRCATLQAIGQALKVSLSILIFLAAGEADLAAVAPALAAKLAYTTFKLLEDPNPPVSRGQTHEAAGD